MKRFIHHLKWDFVLQIRYRIVSVVVIITVLYMLVFSSLPKAWLGDEAMNQVLILLILSDPVMLGFMFIGALVLFEKSANTLSALVITPMQPWQYLWSKASTLTIIALFCGLVMAAIGYVGNINYGLLICGIILSSLLFVFIGFVGVARVKTFNQYIIILPLAITPLCFPILNFLGITDTYLWYIIPTQASLLLLGGSFRPIETWKIIYSVIFLSISVWGAYKWAAHSFVKYVVGDKQRS